MPENDLPTVLETERLWIGRLSTRDAPFMLALLNTPDWLLFIGDRGVKSVADAQQYILDGPVRSYERYGFGPYLVKLKSTGMPVGLCGLLKRDFLEIPDIGFAFLPNYVGRGYGYEAATAVFRQAQQTSGITQIAGITHPDNRPSICLLKKLGMRFNRTISRADGVKALLFKTPPSHSSLNSAPAATF